MPNFTEDYNAIGIDADHCLVKYNVDALTRLVIKLSLEDFHQHCGWPEEILDYDLSEENDEI